MNKNESSLCMKAPKTIESNLIIGAPHPHYKSWNGTDAISQPTESNLVVETKITAKRGRMNRRSSPEQIMKSLLSKCAVTNLNSNKALRFNLQTQLKNSQDIRTIVFKEQLGTFWVKIVQ